MLEKFLAFVSEQKLFTTNDRLLVAVSGGLDSIVVTDLLVKGGFNIGIAHCNFQLRGAESDEDEIFVAKMAKSIGCEFYLKRFKTKAYAENEGVSTQMAARELRYSWFEQLKREGNYNAIITAHHANDSIETAIFNFVKGTGVAGLRGIKPKNEQLIRPLIFARRQDIALYAKQNKIKWREDSSNTSIKYSRNFIRNKIVPLMKEINPNLEDTYKITSERMLSLESLLQRTADQFRSKWIMKGEDIYIEINEIIRTEIVVLEEVLKPFGFNIDQIKSLLASIRAGLSGKVLETNKYRLNLDRKQVIISGVQNEADIEYTLEKEGELAIGDFNLSFKANEDLTITTDKHEVKFDIDKLTFPLKLRKWDTGDNFQPLGMKGKKKLSDFMIDEKIPLNLKERIFVLLSDNKVVWVVGHRIDDRFKITSETRNAYHIIMTYD